MSSEKDIKNRKETTSTNATTTAPNNTNEELTSVIKPGVTDLNREVMVITPPQIKNSKVMIVRPSFEEEKEPQGDSISNKAKEISKSFKKTVAAEDEKAKLGKNNVEEDKKVNKAGHSYKQLDKEAIGEQNTSTIPINEERFSISKKTIIEDIKIEKRWITASRKVEIPVPYEQLYVNDKLVKIFDEKDDNSVLSKLKDKILDRIDRNKNKQYIISQQQQQNELTGDFIPLFDDKDRNNNNNQETEKVIPIFGEEIVVSRRTVKIGEIVIKKRKVIENKNVKIDVKKEKVILEYPDGTTKQIST